MLLSHMKGNKMRRALRIVLALTLVTTMSVSVSAQRKPLLMKVEHFYLVSDDSERLFQLFRDEFQLPVVWPFKSYGGFAGGGLSLGNVVMEFVTEKSVDGAAARTEFKGIAFEPTGDTDAAVTELKRRRIAYGEPEPYKYIQDGQERVGWVTIELKGIPPVNAYVFICDYKQREQVAEGRSRASRELAGRGGGPLGVTSLREIVLGVKSVKEAAWDWGKMVNSPADSTATVFSFGHGPRIRLVRAEVEGIQSIVVGVKSRLRAKQFLIKKRMTGKAQRRQLCLDSTVVDGLKVTLIED